MAYVSELLFVDPSVDDVQTILRGLRPGVEARVLDPVMPAARQIAAALADRRNLDAIHIIAHGAPGQVNFSAGDWSVETLSDDADNLAAIGRALADDGELRLWSCDIAAGTEGGAFIDALAEATGADVAASAGRIGAAILGGTWDLTVRSHRLSVRPPLTEAAMAAYAGVLPATLTQRQPDQRLPAAVTSQDTGSAPAATNPQADLQAALEHHRAGRLAAAEEIYRRILDGNAEHADSLHLLGALSLQLDRLDEAIELLRRALKINPAYAEAHNNLGVALQRRGEIEEAVSHFEKAVSLKPDYAQAYSNLAKALVEQSKTGLALACWERAVALTPDDVGVLGDFAAALQRANRFGEAVTHYERALALKPDHVEMHCSFADALRNAGRPSEAIDRYKRALLLAPDHVGAHLGISGVLETEGKTGDATLHYERALALRPDLAHLRFRLCTAQLPILYLDEAEIEGRRAAYRRRLEQLCADVEAGRVAGDLASVVGSNLPFYLPYQGQNDRDLQSLYGSLVCKVIAEKYPAAPMPPPPAPTEKVRVGIVSAFFRHHSNWKIPIKGWLSQLDRQKFELFGYYTGKDRDAQTEIAASLCDRFVQGPLPGERWREEILADRPHILIYPEIGMDPVAAWLAAHRLAPIQCASWGHPNTTGYPTIDYFLSSELMEPPDAEQHYTEHLVRLPNLSIYYEPLDLAPVSISRGQLGLRPSAVAYWCGQSLFKYLPQFDQVYPRIAREVGDCQFLFIQSHYPGETTARLSRRLDRAFAVFGLDAAKHCVFLPRLGLEQFGAVIGQCDVVLDSIGWSGCNSTLEGLAHDTPIVTMAGPMMRGRHTMAILKRMGLTDTIAETVDDYVALAARLGRDVPWRTAVKQQISKNKHQVYRDAEVTAALEGFLCRVARPDVASVDESQDRAGLRPPRGQTVSRLKSRAATARHNNSGVRPTAPTPITTIQ